MRLFLLPLLLSLCSASALAQPLTVEDARVRAVPPGSPTTAAFMELTNPGDTDLALVGGSSPLAATLELHNHAMVDGVMQMRQVDRIVVPAGETVRLAPGGWHLMLFDLTRTPVEGERVAFSLTLDSGETLRFEAQVRRVMPMSSPDDAAH